VPRDDIRTIRVNGISLPHRQPASCPCISGKYFCQLHVNPSITTKDTSASIAESQTIPQSEYSN